MKMKFIQIDEEGYPLFNGLRTQDDEFGKDLLNGIRLANDRRIFICDYQNEPYVVEAFHTPYIAQQVYKISPTEWEISLPYDLRKKFNIDSVRVDEWDRFYGRTHEGVIFAFSQKAQNEFFNLVDEVYEDRIEVDEESFPLLSYFESNQSVSKESFWTEKYLDPQTQPGWDLKGPHPALEHILPQIKISKTRILVLGCGRGHDCAYLAQKGHLVTGIDFSEAAIKDAQELYGNIPGLKFVKVDAFHLPEKFRSQYDLVLEHTFYCAVEPSRRNEVLRVWKECLTEGGFLLGIFFILDSIEMPPFGSTEWELRERLKSSFQFLFWNRWHGPSTRSQGAELIIYARRT